MSDFISYLVAKAAIVILAAFIYGLIRGISNKD